MEVTDVQLILTQSDELFSPANVFLVVVFTIIMVTTIVGNALVLIAVMTTKKLQTITNHFLCSLAVADLLIGSLIMPPAIIQQLNDGAWKLGQTLCDAWVFIDVLLCSASILSLCVISTDRYWSVTQPLTYSKRQRSKSFARRMIALSWMSALAIAAPLQLHGVRDSSSSADDECSLNASAWYIVFLAGCSFLLPMLLMLVLYSRIYHVMSNRLRGLQEFDTILVSSERRIPLTVSRNKSLSRPIRNIVPKRTSFLLVRSIPPISRRLPSKVGASKNTSGKLVAVITVKAARNDGKTVGRVAVIVGAFLVCWLPFFVTYLASPFVTFVLPDLLISAINWLSWTNSAINPVIYTLCSAYFRQAFLRLIMIQKKNNASPV